MIKDISGERFGRLVALKYSHKNRNKKSVWLCKCDCGNEAMISLSDLRSGRVNSCGCLRKEVTKDKNFKDLTGKKFGKLTVLKIDRRNQNNQITWKCICECGEMITVKTQFLTGEKSNKECDSCFLKRTGVDRKNRVKRAYHGLSNTRIYRQYKGMKNRCYDKNRNCYKHYGGRGIKVCDEWLGENGFINFYDWSMKNGYSDELTIDRINVNGNYEPSNCRWATIEQQANNRRNNLRYTLNGITMTASEWAKYSGINYGTLISRLQSGMNIKDAINKPVNSSCYAGNKRVV